MPDINRTSSAIDSKVCNKKVAVDDSVTYFARLKVTSGEWSEHGYRLGGGNASDGRWSCVDYTDNHATKVLGYDSTHGGKVEGRYKVEVKRGYASKRNELTLSRRFRTAGLAEDYAEDGAGTCTTTEAYGMRHKPCEGHAYEASSPRGDITWDEGLWWTDKQTNRGWPGTAEGKINTAQGMAGDLVSNLNSEEKDTVAQILTRSVSGGEVVCGVWYMCGYMPNCPGTLWPLKSTP